MSDYEREAQEREKRINVMRLTRALYEAIGGEFAGVESSTVQYLAQRLHYLPDQLITDIKDTYRYCTDKVYEDREKLGDYD